MSTSIYNSSNRPTSIRLQINMPVYPQAGILTRDGQGRALLVSGRPPGELKDRL